MWTSMCLWWRQLLRQNRTTPDVKQWFKFNNRLRNNMRAREQRQWYQDGGGQLFFATGHITDLNYVGGPQKSCRRVWGKSHQCPVIVSLMGVVGWGAGQENVLSLMRRQSFVDGRRGEVDWDTQRAGCGLRAVLCPGLYQKLVGTNCQFGSDRIKRNVTWDTCQSCRQFWLLQPATHWSRFRLDSEPT